ncbi:sialic acid TRAP transporter substrate-binding protein SiaP [Zhihengliuella alba]|uniref:Sialic acid TRAP transporter substrate-binding protein SiaP n=1 Tax=Zhihengliuella alba TaxID=547018 RepID=A0ABP7DYQ9_9MICC
MNIPRKSLAIAALLPLGLLTACGGSGGEAEGGDGNVELTFAHSYTQDQPPHRCGAQVIKEEAEGADVGLTVEIYDSSQLGGDADRIASVASGDIDIDLQGASALSALHTPIGMVDAAYVFEDGQHLTDFFRSEASDDLVGAFEEASQVNVLGAWSIGARHFTANSPIRTPEDLDGLRMRFPGSPQFLQNAEALGAAATEVAYEELYLALQQGTVDGQENPLTNIDSQNMAEVQDYLSLSGHSLNSNLIVVGPVWDELDAEQQEALQAAIATAEDRMVECVAEAEEELLNEYRSGDRIEIVDDVDVEAFQERTDAWYRENLEGEQLAAFEAIRGSAE